MRARDVPLFRGGWVLWACGLVLLTSGGAASPEARAAAWWAGIALGGAGLVIAEAGHRWGRAGR